MEDGTDLMGTNEAAAYLHIAVGTLKHHVARGHIAPRKIGRTLLFTRMQLDAFAALPRNKGGRPKKPRDKD